MTKRWVIDVEANGLFFEVSKIWCIVAKDIDKDDKYVIFTDECIKRHSSGRVFSLDSFKRFVRQEIGMMIGHNILGYDLPVLQKIRGMPYSILPDKLDGNSVDFIDTLVWSQHLFPFLQLPSGCPTTYKGILPDGTEVVKPVGPHSLAAYGHRVGISKPGIEDWRTQPIETYLNRCIEDTRINEAVFKKYFLHHVEGK